MENNQNPNQFNGQQYDAPNNGQYNQQYGAPNSNEPKQKMVAGLLAILLGGLGIHKFYLGDNQKGIMYLLISLLTCGIGATVITILSIIEGIRILTGEIKTDFYGNPLV